jgi:hypothetical protein
VPDCSAVEVPAPCHTARRSLGVRRAQRWRLAFKLGLTACGRAEAALRSGRPSVGIVYPVLRAAKVWEPLYLSRGLCITHLLTP